MDEFIANYKYIRRNGLNICNNGIAYQVDMSKSVEYSKEYFDKYVNYEQTKLGQTLNEMRVNMVQKYCNCMKVLDVGVGCGTFVKMANKGNLDAFGYDINSYSVNWLKSQAKYYDIATGGLNFTGITFWDALEHIPEPQKILERINLGTYVYISIPTYDDFDNIEKSRHYRPDEHYYYFTSSGLMKWLREYGLCLVMRDDFESKLGRDHIKTFVFEKRIINNKKNSIRNNLVNYFEDQQEENIKLAKELLK